MDDPNKLHHLLGDSKHNLDVLVREYGSEEVAGSATLRLSTRLISREV